MEHRFAGSWQRANILFAVLVPWEGWYEKPLFTVNAVAQTHGYFFGHVAGLFWRGAGGGEAVG